MITRQVHAGVVVLILTALATLAVSESAWGQEDRDRDRDGGYSINSFRPVQIDFGGGGGGKRFSEAKCGPGSVATGFHVQMGEFFNLVWVDCAHLRRNGSLDRDLTSTEQAGTPGGRRVADAQCPAGSGLIGLRGRTGASIDEAVGQCVDPRDVMERREERHEGRRPEFTNPITTPNPGGQPAEARCEPGQVMVGLRAKSGEWIDHLWVLCANIEQR